MIAAVLAQAATAGPQQAAADPQATVVVTGRRLDRDKELRRMIARLAPVRDSSRTLPRFASPVCPVVEGLSSTFAARIVERMRRDLHGAGIAAGQPGCAANVTVTIVSDGQTVVRALHKTKPAMFNSMDPDQIRRLEGDGGPVHLWSATEIRSREDENVRVNAATGAAPSELSVHSASIVRSAAWLVVDGVTMLLDQKAVVGKTVDQLADYTVMRAVAQARPIAGAADEPTIVQLFEPGAPPPAGLTAFDTAYLAAYYQGGNAEPPAMKAGLMARSISRSLEVSPAAAGIAVIR